MIVICQAGTLQVQYTITKCEARTFFVSRLVAMEGGNIGFVKIINLDAQTRFVTSIRHLPANRGFQRNAKIISLVISCEKGAALSVVNERLISRVYLQPLAVQHQDRPPAVRSTF